MSFWDLFRRKEKRADTMIIDANLQRILGAALDEDTALNIPAFSACVDFICGKIAELPIRLYRDNLDGKTEEVTDDIRVKLLNDETGDLLDPYQLKYAVVYDYLIRGTGFIYPEMSGNEFLTIRYVDSRNVSVVTNSDSIFKVAKYFIDNRVLYDDELIRVCRNSKNGVKGKSIVTEHETFLTTAYKEILYEKYLVETGGNKKGFLQTEKHVDMDVLKKIKEDWEKLYSNEGHSIVVLNDGLKFTESSNTSVEMQLNESIKRNNDLVCEMFGLSPKIISGAASDDEYVTAIKTAVMPIVAAFQSALNTGMLLPSERGIYYFAFDMKQLLKGDILKRYQAYRIALQSRFMQPNEVRYEEDFEPYEYDFITLGLSDVLLDLKNKTIYTPNTNQTVKFGEAAVQKSIDNQTANAIIEDRYNLPKYRTVEKNKGQTSSKIICIWGAPCSGKTTYVENHAGENDIIWDWDKIKQAIGITSSHDLENQNQIIIDMLLKLRYTFLKNAENSGAEKVWFICIRPNDFIKKVLGENVEYIKMDVSKSECLKRLEKDNSRKNKQKTRQLIDDFFSDESIENRYNDGSNYTKDEHGRFTGSTGTGGGSGGGGGGGGGSSGGGLAKTDLTDDETAALNSYVSSESYKINEKLRSGAKLTDDEQRMVDNLDSALQKMPKYEGIVYRSLDSSVMSNPEEFWKIHTPNRIVNYKSFTSSSTSVYDKNMNIQMIIKSKNGKDIRGYNSNEQEILFGRNSVFKVTNVINNTIYMEEV